MIYRKKLRNTQPEYNTKTRNGTTVFGFKLEMAYISFVMKIKNHALIMFDGHQKNKKTKQTKKQGGARGKKKC